MFINIENVKIYYEIIGNDNNVNNVLLIHGWAGDTNSMNLLAKKLSLNFKVFSLDLPGFGMSESLNEFDSYKLAEIVEKFILKLNLKFFLIIGHSLGAKVSSILASKGYGEKLILIGSPGIKYKRDFIVRFKTFIIKIVKFTLTKILFIKENSKIFKKLRSKVGSLDYKNASDKMKISFKNIISEELSEVFSKIETKTLVVQGTEDKEVPLEIAYKIKELIKDSELLIIKGANHFCYNHPIFLEKLNNFLDLKNQKE